jgi:phospholipase/carboxylesterase
MSYVHHFRLGSNAATPPLVLLHCSGGNEHGLAPLADDLAPGSPILGVRSGIPFDGGDTFFHRLPDPSIDEGDITSRATILADFIEGARSR